MALQKITFVQLMMEGIGFFSGCLSEYNHVQMYNATQENVHSYVVKMYISNMQSAQLVNNSSG